MTAEAHDDAALRDWLAVRNAVRWRMPMSLAAIVHERTAKPLRADLVVRDADGRPVGCARIGPHGWSDPADRLAACDIFVLPEARGAASAPRSSPRSHGVPRPCSTRPSSRP